MVWATACQGKRGESKSGDKCYLHSSHCCVTLRLSLYHSGLTALPSTRPLVNSPIHFINFMSTCYVPDTMPHIYLVLTKYNHFKDKQSNSLSSRNSRSEKHKQTYTTLLVLNEGALITRFKDGQVYKGIEIVLPDKEDYSLVMIIWPELHNVSSKSL